LRVWPSVVPKTIRNFLFFLVKEASKKLARNDFCQPNSASLSTVREGRPLYEALMPVYTGRPPYPVANSYPGSLLASVFDEADFCLRDLIFTGRELFPAGGNFVPKYLPMIQYSPITTECSSHAFFLVRATHFQEMDYLPP